jgi:short-subunit dehydrogenase
VQTDVTNSAAVDALAAEAVENFGKIDVWVNCAGVSVFGTVAETPLTDFRRVLDVNVMGYVYGARAALEVMTDQGSGVLVNVASVLGEVPQPYTAAYGMSKAAVRALGVSLRQELALQRKKHIRVATVLPPTVDTPFFGHAANYTGRAVRAMPPVYGADQVAKAIVRAAKHPRPEIVVGAAAKALVKQHRKHAVAVEAQMAALTENGQLSKKSGSVDTAGNLYTPSPDYDASVDGGWHGKGRHRGRTVLVWLLLAAVGGALLLAAGGASPTPPAKRAKRRRTAAESAKMTTITQANLNSVRRAVKKQRKAAAR